MKNTKALIILFIALLCFGAKISASEQGYVLVVSTTSLENAGTKAIYTELKSTFLPKGIDVKEESLKLNIDKYEYSPEEKEKYLVQIKREQELFQKKYGKKPKAIVFIDDMAWLLCKPLLSNVWKNTPSVICLAQELMAPSIEALLSVNSENIEQVLEPTHTVTHGYRTYCINQSIYYKENIDLIKKLRPQMKTILFISDGNYINVAAKSQIKHELSEYHPEIKLKEITRSEISEQTLIEELKKTNNNDGIMYISRTTESNSSTARGENNLCPILYAFAKAPVFTISDVCYQNEFTVGGVYTPMKNIISQTLTTVDEILSNEEVKEHDLAQVAPQTIINYKNLIHFGINPELCPPSTVFVDAPPSLTTKYLWQIIFYSTVAIFLFVLVLMRKRRKEIQRNATNFANNAPIIYIRYKKILNPNKTIANDLLFLNVNNAFETIFGCKKERVINKKLSSVIKMYPEISAISPASIEINSSLIVHGRNGKDIHLGHIRICEHKNNIVDLFCSDITDIFAARNQAESYKQLFEEIIDVAPVGITARDVTNDMSFILWNKTATEIYGITKEEIITFPEEVIRNNKLLAQADKLDHDLVKSDTNYNNIRRIKKEDGTELTISYNKYFTKHPNGNKILFTIAYNVTDFQKGQSCIKRINDQVPLIINTMAISSWTWDLTEDILYCNNEGIRKIYPQAPLIKKMNKREFFSSIFKEDLQNFINAFELVCKGEKDKFDLQIRIKRYTQGETYVWVRTFCTVIETNENGKPTLLSGATININSQKETEKELREAKEVIELEKKNQNSFLKSISHEIRTPLNAIVGFAEILTQTEKIKEREEYTSIIKTNSKRLLELIDDILDISKIEGGSLEFKYETTDINPLFEELESLSKERAGNPSIDIVFTERLHRNQQICTDKKRLMQIMNNLVSNAIKHTTKGSIEFGYRRNSDNSLYFFVTDTGEGIDQEKQKAILEHFVKSREGELGAGLGLTISKSIVYKMGGKIGVDSTLGEGSTFWFTLPEYKAPLYIEPKESEREETQPKDIHLLSKPLILIAEDDKGNFRLFETVLRNFYRIVHAWNGEEAVKLFKEHNPAIILMDIRMPILDGYGATAQIRNISKDVPIIAVTAFAYEQDKIRISERGFSAYIAKPIKTQLLHEKIESLINK